MKNTSAFTVYDAAAGAGKTHTLVKNYLLKVLSSTNKNRYKQILAVTFTNKAVAEMKQRILESLHGFSKETTPKAQKSMFLEIAKELSVSESNLQKKSEEVLHYLLHNYTAFNVQTIDKFTQSIIRTFAFDLGLSTNFEVELNQKSILELAIDELINKVGKDGQLTKVIVEFTKNQIDNDASWNIKNTLLDTANIIFKDDDLLHLEKLSERSFVDFQNLNNTLKRRKLKNEQYIKELCVQILSVFSDQNLLTAFFKNSIPNYFKKLKDTLSDDFKAGWKNDIENTVLYSEKESEENKLAIEALKSQIFSAFSKTRKLVFENQFIDRILKNSISMSLLKSINDSLRKIKKEKQIILISDFNKLIFDTIKDQPTPFIYERLGERFKDFYIDEFQDTSVMQWNNLLPLLDNAVSALNEKTNQTGTVTIVGDAKQAIYRWRGGKAEQFMQLSVSSKSPFSNPKKETIQLNTNYRSYSNIIEFNNSFFTYLSNHFSNNSYSELYKSGNNQNSNSKNGGYVQFDFIEANNVEEKNALYPCKVLSNINKIIENGFLYKDICILVRKNKEGVEIANYLNEHKVPVLSYEALLVKNSNAVVLLINTIIFALAPDDRKKKLNFLKALAVHLKIKKVHFFLKEYIDFSEEEILENLIDYDINIDFKCIHELTLLEVFDTLIIGFKLHNKPNPNIQFFMDFVFEYNQKKNAGINEFILHWKNEKDKLSIVVPEGQNAVQIMSIHKSKGLEFPVVIYPYADTDVLKNKPKNVWVSINEFSTDFEEAYVGFNERLFLEFSEETSAQCQLIKERLELDNFNVLYVALTRAKEQLYIISNDRGDKDSIYSFQSYFKEFLKTTNYFNETESGYNLGNESRSTEDKIHKTQSKRLNSFNFSLRDQQRINVVSPLIEMTESQKESVNVGLFVHELMADVYDREDLPSVLLKFKKKEIVSEKDFKSIKQKLHTIIDSPLLKKVFDGRNKIYNERDFVFEREILRPDRVEFTNDNSIVIIDYKTGRENQEHKNQILQYELIFRKTESKKIQKIIIYIEEKGVTIKSV